MRSAGPPPTGSTTCWRGGGDGEPGSGRDSLRDARGLGRLPRRCRHSHITGLVRSGASIMEAKELARHADIRQTAKYTHIGMENRAEALGNLPVPKTCAPVELSGICRVAGGVLSQEVSPDDSDDDPNGGDGNEKTPSGEGVSSSANVACQELAFDVSSGGGGNEVDMIDLLVLNDLRRSPSFLSDTLSDTSKDLSDIDLMLELPCMRRSMLGQSQDWGGR